MNIQTDSNNLYILADAKTKQFLPFSFCNKAGIVIGWKVTLMNGIEILN